MCHAEATLRDSKAEEIPFIYCNIKNCVIKIEYLNRGTSHSLLSHWENLSCLPVSPLDHLSHHPVVSYAFLHYTQQQLKLHLFFIWCYFHWPEPSKMQSDSMMPQGFQSKITRNVSNWCWSFFAKNFSRGRLFLLLLTLAEITSLWHVAPQQLLSKRCWWRNDVLPLASPWPCWAVPGPLQVRCWRCICWGGDGRGGGRKGRIEIMPWSYFSWSFRTESQAVELIKIMGTDKRPYIYFANSFCPAEIPVCWR